MSAAHEHGAAAPNRISSVRWQLLPALAALLAAAAAAQSCALAEDLTDVQAERCADTSDCILAQDRCCLDCRGSEPMLAVTRAQKERLGADCGPPKCGPPDFEPGELECDEGYYALAAVCEDAKCTLLDVLSSRFSACERDDQCQLRAGTGCCERCSSSTPAFDNVTYYAGGLVAFSDVQGFLSTYCGHEHACPDCEPLVPNEVSARCVAGHCRVIYDGVPVTFGG